uniref:ATP-binding cassette sub-family G member 4 n=1 Tax=Lygus hesperus TaxID=30085 RepID=A0A0A9YT30_LYGHE
MFYEQDQRTLMLPLPRSPSVDIQFTDVTFTVSSGTFRKESKKILKGTSGLFRSGELTAIMGPSGAGKSSLLNILTGFHVAGMGGQIKFNGEVVKPGQRSHRKMSCYIMQDDYLNPHFTVAEIMKMAAHLKLGDGLPGKAKDFVVEEILDSLGLTHTKDTKCCRLSGGQKKRLCIALELLDNPPIVFLDEPTTGLDSSSTVQLVTVLKGLARCGRTIVCTIHQPSASIFELFDHTYMLSKGECCYQGSSKNVVPFLQTIGLTCPKYHNPADFVLDVLNGDFGNFDDAMKLASKDPTWRIPPTPLDNADEKPPTVADENAKTMVLLSCPSELTRFWILYKRNLVQLHRDWTSTYLKMMLHLVTGIVTGCLFINAGQDGSKSLSNLGYLMAVVVYQSFTSVMPAVLKIPGEIDVLRKEQFNNWYKLRTFYLAFLSSRLPAELFTSMFFVIVSYYLSGQVLEIERFSKFVLISNLVVLISECIGITLGAITNPVTGTFWGSVLLAVLILLGGYLAILTHMPRVLYYVSYANFMRYSFQGLVYTAYGDHRAILPCPDEEFYCHLRYPQKLLSEIGMTDVNFWNDATCLSGMTLLIAFFSYYSLCQNIKSRT